jgi:osmotically-inducible protein OsmY
MANRYDRERYGARYDDNEERPNRTNERGRGNEDYERERYGRERAYGGRRQEERGLWDKASDEVSSWLGDEEAARRRQIDEMEQPHDREGYYNDYERRGSYRQGRSSYGSGRSNYNTSTRKDPRTSEYEANDRSDYGQGYYGQYEREGRMFGTSGSEYERGYRPDILESDSPYGGNENYGRYRTDTRSSRGRFSGLGPRGYQRTDDRIREDVNDRLTQHGEIDATEIEVSVNQGEVTLSGTVDNRWTKRLAEDIVEEVSGVRNVVNLLRVYQGFRQNQPDQWTQSNQVAQEKKSPESEQTGRSKSTTAKGS